LRPIKDLTGKKFHRLTVIKKVEDDKKEIHWVCLCDCGNKKVIRGNSLKSGNTKSCGCYNSEVHRGIAKKNFKKIWEPIDQGSYYDIPLSKETFSKVDKEDYDKIKEYKWYYNRKTGYAYSGGVNQSSGENSRKKLSRFIMGINSPIIQIDHINGDRLDNRKANLRIATNEENCSNSFIRIDNTSGHRGVSFDRARNKWFAEIVKGKKRHRKRFIDKKDAIQWYKKMAIELFDEFCSLSKYER
jgi:hypothetical protein